MRAEQNNVNQNIQSKSFVHNGLRAANKCALSPHTNFPSFAKNTSNLNEQTTFNQNLVSPNLFID